MNTDTNSIFDSALAAYVVAAKEHGKATHEGNSIRANNAYTKLIAALETVKKLGRLHDMKHLLLEVDPYVRLWSATHLVNVFPNDAIGALRLLVGGQDRIAAFDARMVITEIEKGNIK